MIGIATSIDALVTGATIYFMQTPIWLSAVIIGCTTFACAAFGYGLCRVLKRFSTKYLEVAAGIILIALGCKVLLNIFLLKERKQYWTKKINLLCSMQ